MARWAAWIDLALLKDARKGKLTAAWPVINAYEQRLMEHLIGGLQLISGVRIYGITSRFDWDKRVATVSIRKEGTTPHELAQRLADANIFVWDGNFYALALSERLGVEASGGLLRIGLAHYNTAAEVDACLAAIERA